MMETSSAIKLLTKYIETSARFSRSRYGRGEGAEGWQIGKLLVFCDDYLGVEGKAQDVTNAGV